METVIGIDFGTTNSVMAIIERGKPRVLHNHRGETLTPSVVGFSPEGESVVGTAAKNQSLLNPEYTIASVKRSIGKDDKIHVGDMLFSPEEVAARILAALKRDAEEYLESEVTEAVVTVPAYFSDAKRNAIKTAGRIAGLSVLRIINEPTAAALAYGFDGSDDEVVLVYDLGGGTFDVSILELGGGIFEVKSTAGDNYLGGDDFDNLIIHRICEEFREAHGITLPDDPLAMQKLKAEAEKAKIALSDGLAAAIEIPFISATESGPIHLSREITRDEFEGMIAPLIEKTIVLTEKALRDARLDKNDIDNVLLVGGSTRIPYVRKVLGEYVGHEVTAKMDPEQSVALGAAIQCGIIKGEVTGKVLVDITPLSLGIEIDGGLFIPIIQRNTPIPCEAKRKFTTITDDQEIVEVHIMQGERKIAKENISLGKFQLQNISKGPKGNPRIEISFDIDVDGIVSVSAYDLGTKSVQQIVLNSAHGLDEDTVIKMIDDAEENRERDRTFQLRVEKANEAKTLITEILNYFEDHSVKEDVADEVRDDIKMLNDMLERDDTDLEDVIFGLKAKFHTMKR